MTERIVVVGAGLAGLRAAERIRELGFGGELVILGAEPGMPYHRPALSKQVLTGEIGPAGTRLAAPGDVDAQWRLDTAAVHLQPGRQVIHLPGAEELRYDGLVIATGVEPRRLAEVPHGHPRVVVLRTLADAVTLHQGLAGTTGPVAVLGGGFIGCEVASSLRAMNRDVAIIDRSPTLLGDELGQEVGARLTAVHAAHGVRLELGTSIRRWRLEPTGLGIELIDGRTLEVECAVVALGTVPSVSWLRGAKLSLDDGVVCGPTCHVLGAKNVVAAGDVAQWPNLLFDPIPRRVEHWLNAVEMGRAAAESLLAGVTAAKPFTPVPRFWSEQHGVRIQAAGMPKLASEQIQLSPATEDGLPATGFVHNGRLVGAVGLDSPAELLHWTAEIARQHVLPVQTEREEKSHASSNPVESGRRRGGAHRIRDGVVTGG